MSDLRELIAGRIWHDDWVKSVGEEPPYPWDSEEYEDGMSSAVDAEYRDTADRIVELVREALLAPEVWQRAAMELGDHHGGGMVEIKPKHWRASKVAIEAALDAVTERGEG